MHAKRNWATSIVAGLIGLGATPVLAVQQGDPSIEVIPDAVYIEEGRGAQLLNFDFLVSNPTSRSLSLQRLRVSAFDALGTLIHVRSLDGNGFPATEVERGDASIHTLHGTTVDPEGTLYVFNPFYSFDADLDLRELRYEFLFVDTQGAGQTVSVTVRPTVYESRTDLVLPLSGRVLVTDGHEVYSHHRRMSLNHPIAEHFGIGTNSSRYAYDLNVVDELGRMQPSAVPSRREDYYGWEAPVLAPGSGTVVRAVNNVPDNQLANGQVAGPNPMAFTKLDDFFGNHVVIDHGNGEFSALGHLREGSVTVGVGDRVTRGQVIATLGLSGSTFSPHVHYQLQTGASAGEAEGLPSYFKQYRRLLGERSEDVVSGQIDTGDFVQSLVRSPGSGGGGR